jgi:predicted  nucleic acid-binding Zn-ribbon protein
MAKKIPTQLCAVEYQLERVMEEIKKLEAEVEALRKELEGGGE